MKMLIAFAAAAGLFSATQAGAQSALQLQALCRDVANGTPDAEGMVRFHINYETGLCWGAFASLPYLAATTLSPNEKVPILGFCAPTVTTRLQFVRIFVKYVDEHPEQGQLNFTDAALLALTAAFPCSKPH
jgi:hypothetical protein